MSTRHAILIFVLGFYGAASANACPACNIHNHLAKSVASSLNIVVGKLATNLGDWRIKAEVVRSLGGSYRAGQVVEMRAWAQGEDVGKLFIFSDPTSAEPKFPILETQCEDEVLFLLRLIRLENKSSKGTRDQNRFWNVRHYWRGLHDDGDDQADGRDRAGQDMGGKLAEHSNDGEARDQDGDPARDFSRRFFAA